MEADTRSPNPRLDELLRAPVPVEATAFPFDTGSSARFKPANGIRLLVLLAAIAQPLHPNATNLNAAVIALFAAAGAASVLALLVDLPSISQRYRVSGEGLAVQNLFRTVTLPWPTIQMVKAKPDVAAIHVVATDGRFRLGCDALAPAKRQALITALRGHLREWGRDVELWTGRDAWHTARETGLLLIPVVLLVTAWDVWGRQT